MLAAALAGALIAISFSAPPGPVTMETVRRGARGGFRPALLVQLGSVVGDMAWCLAALVGLAPLVQIAIVRVLLGVVGVTVLIYLGVLGIREALRDAPAAARPAVESQKGAFRAGMAISLANPQAVGYWLSVGGALIASGMVGQSAVQTGSFISGFVIGTFLWAFAVSLLVRFGRQMLSPAAFRVVTFVCGATMIIFGATLAAQMMNSFL